MPHSKSDEDITSTSRPRRIVCIAIDHSDCSEYAFNWAIENLIKPETDQVVLLNSRPVPATVGPFVSPYVEYGEWASQIEDANREESHSLLKAKGAELLKKGCKIRAIALRGDPRDEIVAKVHELGAHVLVMGSRGMGAFRRPSSSVVFPLTSASAILKTFSTSTVGLLGTETYKTPIPFYSFFCPPPARSDSVFGIRCDLKRGNNFNFAFVEFEDRRDAEDALKATDGKQLQGTRMVVEWAKGGTRKSSEDGCFKCGNDGHWARDCPDASRRDRDRDRRSPRR
ncbi:hypothetical protein HK102_007654, partial [Quaeritorhiza haematococci]